MVVTSVFTYSNLFLLIFHSNSVVFPLLSALSSQSIGNFVQVCLPNSEL